MVTIRPRQDWQSASQPVVGPAINLSKITLLPAHYTAASTVPSDTPPYLRAIQNDYTVNRGYSIGYNFAIDKAGVAWELRGWDIKCAANKDMNEVTIAILCLVDGANAMNDNMVQTFTEIGAEAESRCRKDLLVVGHRDIGSTSCPGDGIYRQVQSGILEPGSAPTPIPPTPTPTPGDDMTIRIFESQTNPKEFNAMFFGECDSLDRSIELQWSGDGGDPAVQARIAVMMENFGPARPLLLAGVKNNRLHPKHRPSDIIDSLHVWTDSDFAP